MNRSSQFIRFFFVIACSSGALSASAAYSVVDLTPTDVITAGNAVYNGAVAVKIGGAGVGALSIGGSGFYAPASGNSHALLWMAASSSSFLDLNPAGASSSSISDLDSSQQVGTAVISSLQQAGYWLGDNTFHPLPAVGFSTPQANGISGSVIVGNGGGASSNALLWQGAPGTGYTLTNLQPTTGGYIRSFAASTDGITVAGAVFITPDTDTGEHAAVWKVADGSLTDLQPAGYHDTSAQYVSGAQVVGIGSPDGDLAHAILWTFNGSSYDLTDLHPAGHDTSEAFATNGTEQVGVVGDDILEPANAYVWSETTDALGTHITAIDLQTDLEAAFPGEFASSTAEGIDAAGDIVGFAIDQSGNQHAILWSTPSAAPEPATLALLGMGALILFNPRRK